MPEGDLAGARIALFEARMGGELSELVRRRGGFPICVSAVREVRVDDAARQVAAFLDAPAGGYVVVLTGAGATALFETAGLLDRVPQLMNCLRRSRLVCRGPKPQAVLKRFGLTSDLHVAEPYTTSELLDCLKQIDLIGVPVTIVHYGERNRSLTDALAARGAAGNELCLYEWRLPDDIQPLAAMVRRIVAAEFDAVAFTSQIQCRHLFAVADDLKLHDALAGALNAHTVVAAIGPTCRDAVLALGVTPDIVPRPPKMGAMVAALGEYFAGRR